MSIPSDDRCRWLANHVLIHEAALRSWLDRRFTVIGADVEDVIQETYAILVSRARVDDIVDPRSYTFQVAKSVVMKSFRRNKVIGIGIGADLALLDAKSDAPSPEREIDGRRELLRVAKVVRAMPPQARQVFWMRRVEGLGQRAIAQHLGLSESTVEKHMMKALRLLRAHFGHGGKRDLAVSGGEADTRWSDGHGAPFSRIRAEH